MELQKIVVRTAANLPTRNRAWFQFTSSPSYAEVTKEQYEEIKNDNYLTICLWWNSLEYWLKCIAKNLESSEPIKEIKEKTFINWISGDAIKDDEDFKPDENVLKPDENILKPIWEYTKQEICSMLRKRWFKEWQDFNPWANKPALYELLIN